jgi:hypothetical protein
LVLFWPPLKRGVPAPRTTDKPPHKVYMPGVGLVVDGPLTLISY